MDAEHDLERLEELVLGTLSAADAAVVEAQVAECTDCRAELALLRAERRAFDRHADDAELPAFEGVLARMPEHQIARAVPATIARPARRPPLAWIIAGAAAIPLAAGVLLGIIGHREPPPVITAVASAAAATPSPRAIPRRHHNALSCEPDADDGEPSCGSCSGEDDDAGEP